MRFKSLKTMFRKRKEVIPPSESQKGSSSPYVLFLSPKTYRVSAGGLQCGCGIFVTFSTVHFFKRYKPV